MPRLETKKRGGRTDTRCLVAAIAILNGKSCGGHCFFFVFFFVSYLFLFFAAQEAKTIGVRVIIYVPVVFSLMHPVASIVHRRRSIGFTNLMTIIIIIIIIFVFTIVNITVIPCEVRVVLARLREHVFQYRSLKLPIRIAFFRFCAREC